MDYENAVKFYYDAGKFRHEPSLEPMRQLCRRLGDPQKNLRFVHIAGTNGKGSCAAMMSAVLEKSGRRVGLFTSPDLVDFAERIQIDRVNITHYDLARLTERVAEAAAEVGALSFFELVTACAFLYFAEQRCDIVVLECGLGGKYDATNIIEVPDLSIIMPIGFDHTALLGDTLAAIAGEKAGIIKYECPVVSAAQAPEALAVIREYCRSMNAPLSLVDINSLQPIQAGVDGQIFHYYNMRNIHLRLLGLHQCENAAAVIEAARILGLDDDTIRAGLADARWPCRMEPVLKDPLFLLDGAHNPHGAAALAASLKACFPEQKFCFIFGVMADKDWRGVLREITPVAAKILCIEPPDERALNAQELAQSIEGVESEVCRSLDEALEKALASRLPCCACGSLYYIGLLREQILKLPRGGIHL